MILPPTLWKFGWQPRFCDKWHRNIPKSRFWRMISLSLSLCVCVCVCACIWICQPHKLKINNNKKLRFGILNINYTEKLLETVHGHTKNWRTLWSMNRNCYFAIHSCHFAALIVTYFCLTKGRGAFFQPVIIVARFSHLMVLVC